VRSTRRRRVRAIVGKGYSIFPGRKIL